MLCYLWAENESKVIIIPWLLWVLRKKERKKEEENKILQTLFEARNVAGSATYKQSKEQYEVVYTTTWCPFNAQINVLGLFYCLYILFLLELVSYCLICLYIKIPLFQREHQFLFWDR